VPKLLSHSVKKAILTLFEDLSTPVSQKAFKLLEAGEWDQLASMEVDPHNYSDSESYWRDATAASLLRKCQDLPTSFDRKAVAYENFFKSEVSCLRTNSRLNQYLPPEMGFHTDVHEFFSRARKICGDILGRVPDSSLTRVQGRFGPGATFGDRGRFTTIPDKMSSRPTFTQGAIFHLVPWTGTLWASACSSSGKYPTPVKGNRFTTVPKDCRKDRGIAVEPSINLFYQLGYGRIIRSRLKERARIDLAKGQDIHRALAREASIRGHLCTLDLSNASDTVCTSLVKLVLPPDWFDVLNQLRSPMTHVNGKWVLLEKFSSMGNGFTFELETLIFLCLILALDPSGQKLVSGTNVFTYGDDILCPTEYSEAVISCLKFCGFELNMKKSFTSGPFRESCGGDFFEGVDVRPHFLKEFPCEPQQLISFANGIRRHHDLNGRGYFVYRSWRGVLDCIPRPIRECRGPEILGDLVIHDSKERWLSRQRAGIRYFRVYRPARFRKVSWSNFRPEVVLASACYGAGDGGISFINSRGLLSTTAEGIIPRDAVSGYKTGWVAYS